jgi:hypothetical protein
MLSRATLEMFSPPFFAERGGQSQHPVRTPVPGSGPCAQRERERERERQRTGYDDVLGSILDLRAAVGMPHGQVARVKHAAGEQLARRLGVGVVALGADVAQEDDLANLLAVLGHVDERGALGLVRPDDADGQAGDEAVPLPSHVCVHLLLGQVGPARQEVSLGDGAVRLGEPVHVNRVEVKIRLPPAVSSRSLEST